MDKNVPTPVIADKETLRKVLHRVYNQIGIAPAQTATAQEVRERMLKDGIRPEDNAFSCAIIAARNEESLL